MKIASTILTIALVVALALSSIVLAETLPVSRAELMTATVDGDLDVGKILSHRIEMAPKVAGQKHFHPMPVVGYVVTGEIAFQIEGGKVQNLKTGDAFFEPANAIVVRWENVGDTRAVFIANYIAASDAAELLIRVE